MSNSLSNVPYFFSGTYDELLQALSPGGQFYPLKKIAYAFVTDRKAIAYCRTDGSITLVGDDTKSVQPEQGTVANPIILDQLPPGVYSINGTYQMSPNSEPINISATQLFIVGDTGVVSKLDGNSMTKQVVTESGTIVQEEYITDAEIVCSLATKEDISNLFK